MKTYDFLVLGGGLAGLAFAKKISEKGHSVLILEKDEKVGGLSRSLNYNEFYLDFCAHRFHSNNPEVINEVLKLPGLKMYEHNKKSRIYMFDKYLKYPFEIQNLLRAMPIKDSMLGGFSFFINKVALKFKKREIVSYKDWFIYFYGKRLYNVMCYPYTSKIWHMDPAKISADWADQRFQGENMSKLIKRMIKKVIRFDFSSYSLEDDKLAPDGGMFYYPMRGIQELPDAFARNAVKNGTKIICSAKVNKISRKSKSLEYSHEGKRIEVKYENLISTIPMQEYYALQDKKERNVSELLKQMRYMDIIFVYVFLDKKKVSNDHWLYFPDKDIIFNRAVEFSNWSDKMCPPGKTSICFDITAFENDHLWKMSDEAITQKVISDAARINYIERKNIIGHKTVRVRHAYPVYDLGYKAKLDQIAKFLEDKNAYLLGRTGMFKYNNADNSVEMAFELANNFISKRENKSIYNYKIKKVSY